MSETTSSDDEKSLTQTKVSTDVVRMARVVAAHTGRAISDLIGDCARPKLRQLYRNVIEELNRDAEPKSKAGA